MHNHDSDPVRPTVRAVRRAGRWLAPAGRRDQLARLALANAGHGYDTLGAHPDWIRLAHGLLSWLYDYYFRVESSGHEHLPQTGPAVLAANHSGALPYDAAMLWTDVLRHTDPPRVARPIADHFVPRLPYVSPFFSRMGTVGGSRGNARYLLESGELLLIFPEGTDGILKPFWRRYRLESWSVGHVEIAIRHRAPVIPVAIVGAEEQMPQIGRLPFGLFGVPYIPLSVTPVPLPVRYHIRYGPPVDLSEFAPSEADHPRALATASARVQAAVKALIDGGLSERRGWFR